MASPLLKFQDNECSEMQIHSKSGTLRIQPQLTNPSLNSVPVTTKFEVPNNIQEVKLKNPLPPRQHKWSPPMKSRVMLTLDQAIDHELKHGRKMIPKTDMRSLRRTISNRLSAQRSRMKRLEQINELENRLKYLEVLTSGLRPKVEVYKEKKRLLEEEKLFLEAAVEIRTTESINNEYKIEESRREICSLKEGLMNNDGGQCSKQIKDAVADEGLANPKPYSLEFYQKRLMQMEINQLLIPSSAPAVPEQDSMVDGEVEVDQYLNLMESFN